MSNNNIIFKELEENLKVIKEWIITQKHLPQNIDDQLLRRFIVSCDQDVEKTKKLIDLNYTLRSQAPEIFSNRDPKNKIIADYLEYGDTVPLPQVTENNYKIIIFRVAKEPEHFIFSNILKTVLMVADIRLAKDPVITAGEVPIFDMSNSGLNHLSKLSLSLLKKYMMYTQEAHPVRLKQIHVINIPSYVDKIMYVVKPFMKSEVAAMLNFHTNLESLYKHIPKKILPEEYGGEAGKLRDIKQKWIKLVNDNQDYFLDDSKWKIDESKRPAESKKQKSSSFIGSFRTLTID